MCIRDRYQRRVRGDSQAVAWLTHSRRRQQPGTMAANSQNLLHYEKENNVLLRAIRDSAEHRKIIQNSVTMIPPVNLVVLVPANVTLEGMSITSTFIETHLVTTNPNQMNDSQFVSVNGVRGVFSSGKDSLTVLQPPPKDGFEFTGEMFEGHSAAYEENQSGSQAYTVHLLRESDLELGDQKVPFILISEPLSFENCPWDNPVASGERALDDAGGEDDQESGVAQGSMPRRIRDFLNIFGSSTAPVTDSAIAHDESHVKDSASADSAKTALTYRDFLEKLRQPAATDIVNNMKIFIENFQKRPLQEDLYLSVRSFLDQMEGVLRRHSLWEGASDDEFENAREGLEKLLMTRIHSRAFKPDKSYPEKDASLAARLGALGSFLTLEHLDIAENLHNEVSHILAQKELQKINQYKAPRDKMVCILNCCKVISNLLTHAREGQPYGADEFLPLLIFIVLKANPEDLHSNMQYITNYRHPARMAAEPGYFFTQLVSAVHFLDNVEAASLSIDPELFEKGMNNSLRASQPAAETPAAESLDAGSAVAPSGVAISNEAMECLMRSYRYIQLDSEELRLGDVPELLSDYKKLVDVLKKMVDEHGKLEE
eukprot:TRINITY_DN7998_c0_g1_i3.p1 TRINITY_DN7998_c0_g1~~TRINITY_DN7998_c0_g1_i3.p1  ORF type:complete len:600 (-),score=192.71 TRINITY_DN7998_c0_g1_i3:74-1873(-)